MTRSHDIPVCAWCSKPLPQAKKTGRPRRYCSSVCRLAAFRHRQLIAYVDGEPFESVGSPQEAVPAPGVNTDEQVARAILEAKNLGGSFLRLGHESRPEFAWRCTGTGTAILSALDEFFKEAMR